MKSIGQKIQQIEALSGTRDVSNWEAEFIDSIVIRTDFGKNTGALTEKQVEIIDRIWGRHFA